MSDDCRSPPTVDSDTLLSRSSIRILFVGSHVTMIAVVGDGNKAFNVVCIYSQANAGLNVISYHHPNNHLHMTPSTTQSTQQIKTKCTTCTNKSCRSLNRKTAPLSFTPKPAMASMAAVRCTSSLQTLRTTALHWDLRHTDAVWPASLPRQRRPSESSPLGNDLPASFAKHTQWDVSQCSSKPTTFPERRTISDD